MPAAVLFDLDGTLIEDVPHNTDPARVRARPYAGEALELLRAAGVPAGVVTNQPDLGCGVRTRRQLEAVQGRVEELLGPFAVTALCPHPPETGCACRKPEPGLVLVACRVLGVRPEESVVIGDIGTDMAAADRAGATGVLVPDAATRPQEVRAAPRTAPDLATAVRTAVLSPGRYGGPS